MQQQCLPLPGADSRTARALCAPGAGGASPKGSGGHRVSNRNVGNMPPPDPPPVAIIDDDESLCRSLGRLLRQSGFRPYVFKSAREFLDSPERARLQCLLIDIQLGNASGIDLHRQLRAAGDATPVIYITALTDPVVRTEAQRLGCAGFFFKTDPASAIVEVLRRVTAAA